MGAKEILLQQKKILKVLQLREHIKLKNIKGGGEQQAKHKERVPSVMKWGWRKTQATKE